MVTRYGWWFGWCCCEYKYCSDDWLCSSTSGVDDETDSDGESESTGLGSGVGYGDDDGVHIARDDFLVIPRDDQCHLMRWSSHDMVTEKSYHDTIWYRFIDDLFSIV